MSMIVRFLKIVYLSNGQKLQEIRAVRTYTGMLRNCCDAHQRQSPVKRHQTYQTFRARVYDSYEHEAYREPRLGVLHVEISKRDNSRLLYNDHATDAYHALYAELRRVRRAKRTRLDPTNRKFIEKFAPETTNCGRVKPPFSAHFCGDCTPC